MKASWLFGVILVLAIGCRVKPEVPANINFSLEQAARGEYVAVRLEDSGLKASADVSVSVDGVRARVVSFNERVVVFEVPPEAREAAEPVSVVVSDGRVKLEGKLQILGEVAASQVVALVLPDVDLSAKLEQVDQNLERRENGLFSNLQTVTGEPAGIAPRERLTLLKPLTGTGFDSDLEINLALLQETNSPCLGDLAVISLNGVPLEETL